MSTTKSLFTDFKCREHWQFPHPPSTDIHHHKVWQSSYRALGDSYLHTSSLCMISARNQGNFCLLGKIAKNESKIYYLKLFFIKHSTAINLLKCYPVCSVDNMTDNGTVNPVSSGARLISSSENIYDLVLFHERFLQISPSHHVFKMAVSGKNKQIHRPSISI